MQVEIGLGLCRMLEFRHDTVFIETEIVGVTANETARENPPGKFRKFLPLDRFKKTHADLGRDRDFIEAHAAHLSLTPEVLTKSGHRGSTLAMPKFASFLNHIF